MLCCLTKPEIFSEWHAYRFQRLLVIKLYVHSEWRLWSAGSQQLQWFPIVSYRTINYQKIHRNFWNCLVTLSTPLQTISIFNMVQTVIKSPKYGSGLCLSRFLNMTHSSSGVGDVCVFIRTYCILAQLYSQKGVCRSALKGLLVPGTIWSKSPMFYNTQLYRNNKVIQAKQVWLNICWGFWPRHNINYEN